MWVYQRVVALYMKVVGLAGRHDFAAHNGCKPTMGGMTLLYIEYKSSQGVFACAVHEACPRHRGLHFGAGL